MRKILLRVATKCKKIIKFFWKTAQRSERFFHLLVGMPSYDKYLEYMQVYNPGHKIKSRKDFFKEALEKRYEGKMGRCC